MGTNKSRIFIPKNIPNRVIIRSKVVNNDPNNVGMFSFRININNEESFESLQYSIDGGRWATFYPRNIAANLYNIVIPAGATQSIRIRMIPGDEDVLIRYINLQPSSNITFTYEAPTPIDLPDLLMHYDGNSVKLNGSNVSEMIDRGGGESVRQADSTKQPLYIASDTDFNNEPTVQFNGTNEYLRSADFTNDVKQADTIIFAFKSTTTVTGTFFDGNSVATRNAFAAGTDYILSSGMVLIGGTGDTDKHIAVIRFSDANTVVYIDGGPAIISGNAGDSPLNGLNFGCNLLESACKAFKLAEFLLYDKSLSDAEINNIGGYLGEKYGITWTAVAPHVPRSALRAYINYNSRNVLLNNTNDGVLLLLDQSANQIHAIARMGAQLVPSYKATDAEFNNSPSVDFNGTTNYLVSQSSFTSQVPQPNVYFLVFKATNNNEGVFMDGRAGASGNRFSIADSTISRVNVWEMYAGTEAVGITQADTDIHIALLRFSTTASSMYMDGGTSIISNADAGSNSLSGLVLGANFDQSVYKQFKMAEFRMYNRALTDAEANTVGGQLATIYGTTWTDI